jgi:DNA-directed RNA polymerase specialized sigma24 family protein
MNEEQMHEVQQSLDSLRAGNQEAADEVVILALRSLAHWAEFHETVRQLSDEVRTVFELKYYLAMIQADISRLLKIHPREVSRRYGKAVDELANWMETRGSSTDLA